MARTCLACLRLPRSCAGVAHVPGYRDLPPFPLPAILPLAQSLGGGESPGEGYGIPLVLCS